MALVKLNWMRFFARISLSQVFYAMMILQGFFDARMKVLADLVGAAMGKAS